MLLQRHSTTKKSITFDLEDMTDDSTDIIPIVGLKSTLQLRDRLNNRLSRLAAASVKVCENECEHAVAIELSRHGKTDQPRIELDHELGQFLKSMEQNMPVISKNSKSTYQQGEDAGDDLWESILIYSYLNIDHIVESIKRVFSANQEAFEEFITQWLGLDDIVGTDSSLDVELGRFIISLHQATEAYDRSVGKLHQLIGLTWEMTTKVPHFQLRLASLLWKGRFGKDLYPLICTLAFPRYAHHTFIRAAETCSAFRKLSFHLDLAAPSPSRARFKRYRSSPEANATSSAPITSPPRPRQTIAKGSENVKAASHFSSSPVLDSLDRDIMAVARPFLADEDRGVEFSHSLPAAKQYTGHLIGTVLRRNMLSEASSSWYHFGFVTAKDEDEERRIGGYYRELLINAKRPQAIFEDIVTGLVNKAIGAVFEANGYASFRTEFPTLAQFLSAPPHERPTVWHMVQYLRVAGREEPVPSLKRDYGFQFCKNHDEILQLKGIYTRILAKCEPLDLHGACIFGRLAEFARQKSVYVEHKNRRFLVNDYPNSSVGFDNGEGLERHRFPLFKRSTKR
ncbi:hypothetical protein EK21DRAFT_76773 [Setomelanomma holmii]|uniref:Uncharacterized protein n=1 Tax=Setomelanomma holmii TaxID=210430 RepID=A0A9P4H0D7_9PLEO|nr:hypothetical protein EK21DRAFT_76773 [Setomelanomma holmii]